MSELGDRVLRLRKAKGLSLQKVADISDMSKGYVWELEKGNSVRPSADKIAGLARALGVTVDYLISGGASLADAEDQAFFLVYMSLTGEKKSQMREILKVICGR